MGINPPTILKINAPGTLGFTCKKFHWQKGHGDCPFKAFCSADNNPNIGPMLTLLNAIGSKELRAMADEIERDDPDFKPPEWFNLCEHCTPEEYAKRQEEIKRGNTKE